MGKMQNNTTRKHQQKVVVLSERDHKALSALLTRIKAETRRIERSIDMTIDYCEASNKRMADLDLWMREHGYHGPFDRAVD